MTNNVSINTLALRSNGEVLYSLMNWWLG